MAGGFFNDEILMISINKLLSHAECKDPTLKYRRKPSESLNSTLNPIKIKTEDPLSALLAATGIPQKQDVKIQFTFKKGKSRHVNV